MADDEGWKLHLTDSKGTPITDVELTAEEFQALLALGLRQALSGLAQAYRETRHGG